MQVRKTFRFEAAHVLPHHPGKCSRLHGHSYVLEVAIDGPVQDDGPAQGMVTDFDEIDKAVKRIVIENLDHRSLNEFMENPTSENILLWIWDQLVSTFEGLSELVLWETSTAAAVLRKQDL